MAAIAEEEGDGETGAFFGYSVGISGDVVFLGATGIDETDRGRVFLFRRSSGHAWAEISGGRLVYLFDLFYAASVSNGF